MSKLFFYDSETTGVRHWKNGIHQISGAIEVGGVIVESFNFKVKPVERAIIEKTALDIAGVTEAQIMEYEAMKSVYQKIEKMLAKYVDKFNKKDKFHLVGYNNASFDNHFFRAWFVQNAPNEKAALYGNYFGSWFWSDCIDVMVLASYCLKDVRDELEDFKLMTVAKYLGIEIDETKLHDALYDIELTRLVYHLLIHKYLRNV